MAQSVIRRSLVAKDPSSIHGHSSEKRGSGTVFFPSA